MSVSLVVIGVGFVVVFFVVIVVFFVVLCSISIFPQTIIAGWRQASKVALQALENSALSHVEDEVKFREDLMNIARTTISSKILSQHKDFFAKLAVDAVLRLKGSGNLDAIQIIKIPGGRLDESFLDSGAYRFIFSP